MTTDRYLRCWLVVALIAAGTISARESRAAPRLPAAVTGALPQPSMLSALPALPVLRPLPAAPALGRARTLSTSSPGALLRNGRAPVPRALRPFTLPAELRDSIVLVALSQLGAPYVFGGATPRTGFDCSGLVRYALSRVHVHVPRLAIEQAKVGAPVPRSELQRGDLIAFGLGSRVSHIGIYVGGGRFVHASSVAARVILSDIDRPPSPLIRPIQGARRLLVLARAAGRD